MTGGNLGAEARLEIAFTEGVVSGGCRSSASPPSRDERRADLQAPSAEGVIAPGSDADLVLINPAIHKTLTRDDFHVSDYSPWEGWTVSGWPVTTLLRGKVIADRGRLLGQPGDGRLVPRRIDPVVLRRPAC